MPKNLQSRKRQLVRDAIYDAAIELFARKGFDETTVEEIAEAAGISRRSFFRYFETKDDLLALNTVTCGEILVDTVVSCSSSLRPLDVMREAVLAGAKFTEGLPRVRQIIEIAGRSASARQAHLSRLIEVEEKLAAAYATRLKSASVYHMKPRVLAGLTMLILNNATGSWYSEEFKDLNTAMKHGFLTVTRLFCDDSAPSLKAEAAVQGRKPFSPAKKKLIAGFK